MTAYRTMSINDLRALIVRLRAAQQDPRLNETNRDNINTWIVAALDQMEIARGNA